MNRLSLGKMSPKKARPKRNGPRLQLGKLVDLTWAPAVGEGGGGCCLRALSYLNENQYYMCQRFTRKKCPETRQSRGKERMNGGEDGGLIWCLGCGCKAKQTEALIGRHAELNMEDYLFSKQILMDLYLFG